jgi:hypothetical protein
MTLPVKQAKGQLKPYFKNNYHDKPEGDTQDEKPSKKYVPYVPDDSGTNGDPEAMKALYTDGVYDSKGVFHAKVTPKAKPIYASGVKYILLHKNVDGENVYLDRYENIVFCQ